MATAGQHHEGEPKFYNNPFVVEFVGPFGQVRPLLLISVSTAMEPGWETDWSVSALTSVARSGRWHGPEWVRF
jgi:hypothetical protein